MKSKSLTARILVRASGFVFAGVLASTAVAGAQEKAQTAPVRSSAYDVARENILQGTIVSYNSSSSTGPQGAHAVLRTSSGVVDVHIGNGRLLSANHLALEPGDAVRITGENIALGPSTVFAARVVQKGSQTVTLRSVHGMPLLVVSKGNGQLAGVR
jgi:hypothetical protein